VRRRQPRGWAKDLEIALPLVARHYLRFVQDTEHEADSKAFIARQTAAKTALSHLELLSRMAGGEAAPSVDSALQALDAARHEMDAEETPADDPGEPG
jgi:NAD-dependent oxidoreductase involved in siderophore biosynthesis